MADSVHTDLEIVVVLGTTFLENILIARKDFQFSLAESFEISLKNYP